MVVAQRESPGATTPGLGFGQLGRIDLSNEGKGGRVPHQDTPDPDAGASAMAQALAQAFATCVLISFENREFVDAFDRLHGTNLSRRSSPLDLAIDDAAGRMSAELRTFVEFVRESVWDRIGTQAIAELLVHPNGRCWCAGQGECGWCTHVLPCGHEQGECPGCEP